MAILVTGGAGYIGRVVAEMLHAHGESVVVSTICRVRKLELEL